MIEGVKTKILRVIPDERGRLAEMLRSDDDLFVKFGQCYFTTTYPGVVKAWHYHKIQTDNFVAVKGMFKVALYDARDDSPTRGEVNDFFLGDYNPMLLQIPPGIYHGWKCIGEQEGYVVNVSTECYNYKTPDEYRLPYDTDEIPYDWDIQMG
jgi:dTDP-4-dehydrorhamnose 3,5-epimerase